MHAQLTSGKPITLLAGLLLWNILHARFPAQYAASFKDLNDNTTCAIEADKGGQDSWCQGSTAFSQGDVNAPVFFTAFLKSIRMYIEATTEERLGLTWKYNVVGHLTGRQNGKAPFQILLYAYEM